MILSTALSMLKFRLGSRTDADLDTLIPIEMDQAQFEFERSGQPPWFLLTEDATAETELGERRLPVPEDFLLETEDDALWLISPETGEPQQLDKGELDASTAYWGLTEGTPTGYALAGNYFHLFPTPDAVYSIRLKYYAADAKPTVMAAGATNLWLTYASDLLLARTGRRMAMYLRDSELAQLFAADEQTAAARLLTEQTARDEANRNRSKGD